MIERIIIKNFKGIKNANIHFNPDKNVIVGNNGVGKSTLIEAISLALGVGLNQLEINQYLFHNSTWKLFSESKVLPEILIEVYFSDRRQEEFCGKNNELSAYHYGLKLRIYCDEDYVPIFMANKNSYKHIPCEFFKIERRWFSDDPVKQFRVPFIPFIIDSSSSSFSNRTNNIATRIIEHELNDEEKVTVKGCLRSLRESFEREEAIQTVNSALNEKTKEISEDFKLTVDLSTKMAWNTILCPVFEDIPFHQIGLGSQCLIKTLLSLKKKDSNKTKILIIEEPESHLSHTKTYELLEQIGRFDGQLLVTTHNSYVANKLDLKNLILLGNKDGKLSQTQLDSEEDNLSFFTRVPNYPTLRIALCNKAVLVEGPTDEMILLYYFKQQYGCHPFAKDIELITVGGLSFKHYTYISKCLRKKTAVITDNDRNDQDTIEVRYNDNKSPYIKIFTDKDPKLNTLEPSFVKANENHLQELSDCIRRQQKKEDNFDDLVDFMKNNKTEWAYRLICSGDNSFGVPSYIKDAVDWIIADE